MFFHNFIYTKFDINRYSTFGDYLSNKNPARQKDGQTDKWTDTRKRETYFFVL